MAYLREYQLRGDPFLGSLFGKAVGLGKSFLGLGGGGAKAKDIAKEVAARVAGGIKKLPRGAIPGAGVGAAVGAGALLGGKALLGGGGRRYRRMNVANPKALRRSMRRVQGFAKLARQTISFTHRVKMKKKGRR